MTAKQKLMNHLIEQHGEVNRVMRGTHQQLAVKHKLDHDARRLPHTHGSEGWFTGGDQVKLKIYLSPPKNPGASRNGDRNWTINIAAKGNGWRWEMPGTWDGDPMGAVAAANKLLGWEPNWVPFGWGFQHQEKEEAS
jgi:hypothetical protein